MPWIRFSADYDDKPTPQVTIAYRSGDVKFVTRACADRAIAKGAAALTKKPGAENG